MRTILKKGYCSVVCCLDEVMTKRAPIHGLVFIFFFNFFHYPLSLLLGEYYCQQAIMVISWVQNIFPIEETFKAEKIKRDFQINHLSSIYQQKSTFLKAIIMGRLTLHQGPNHCSVEDDWQTLI